MKCHNHNQNGPILSHVLATNLLRNLNCRSRREWAFDNVFFLSHLESRERVHRAKYTNNLISRMLLIKAIRSVLIAVPSDTQQEIVVTNHNTCFWWFLEYCSQ